MGYILENKNVHYLTLDSGLTVVKEGLCMDNDWTNCENATIYVDGSLRIESNDFYKQCTAHDLCYMSHHGEKHVSVEWWKSCYPNWAFDPKDVKIGTHSEYILFKFFNSNKEYEYLEFDTKVRKNLNQKFMETSNWKLIL